jgi:hypothetical protein
MAAAFTMWVAHVVQPQAESILGSRVTAITDFGTYSCRTIVNSAYQKYGKYLRFFDETTLMSEHAAANAIDISAFKLANGDTVSVEKHWRDQGAKARFLRAVHSGACGYFRVTLGPDANREHYNHFHFDRGSMRACR